jgi:hypothetical protein
MLRERAAYLGGHLTVAPAPAMLAQAQPGTVLTLVLPCGTAAGGTLSAA